MQLGEILHIPLSGYAYAVSETKLVIRIRTAKTDIKKSVLYYGDRVCKKEPVEVTGIVMEKAGTDRLFDYYEAVIKSNYTRICYYFKLTDQNGKEIFYSEYGFSEQMNCPRTQYFQFPYIRREDIIRIPEWTKKMVMYHIFPDSFADKKRAVSGEKKAVMLSSGLESTSKNGGTLQGITDNLDYIRTLGANCIYLNPIFEAASCHKYDIIDYFKVDPCFGTLEDLKNLVKNCHDLGMHVILDGVFNHCGSGFFAFQDVLKKGEMSEYKDWFYQLNFPVRYEEVPNYETFAYVKEMPKLNTGNKEVCEYFCRVGAYWIKEVGVDGWRLDVANEVNHEFWREFRRAVRREKEDVFLIGEIWEDSTIWLQGDQFDSTMNYSFSYICKEFFADQCIGVREFDEKINHMNLRYPYPVTLAQMNFLDTHDVPRFLSYCGGDMEKLKLAVFFMMTAPGIPSIFYGDEKGIEGKTEAKYRAPMPWEAERTAILADLENYYQKLADIRKEHEALCCGNYRTFLTDEKQQIYVFRRKSESEEIFVMINRSQKERVIALDCDNRKEGIELLSGKKEDNSRITCDGMSGKLICFVGGSQ